MKKLITASLAAGLLFTAGMSVNQAEAHGEAKQVISKKSILPDLTDKKTVAAMKNGTFSYKGVKLGTTFGDVEKYLGKAVQKEFPRESGLTYGTLIYADKEENMMMINSAQKNKKLAHKSYDVQNILYALNSPINFNDIKSSLGNYKRSERDDDFIIRQYGNHLAILLVKEKKKWMVNEIYYTSDGKEIFEY